MHLILLDLFLRLYFIGRSLLIEPSSFSSMHSSGLFSSKSESSRYSVHSAYVALLVDWYDCRGELNGLH